MAGASGLVGGFLLAELLASDDYERVVSLGRRVLPLTHPKLVQRVVDFAALDAVAAEFRGDDVFCALGTTIRRAGSREAFRAVDQVAVLALAWAARRAGATRFFVVSSVGADAQSRVFYSRVKGEMEDALAVMDFPTLAIFRPSLLRGPRAEKRIGESLAAAGLWLVEPLMVGGLRKYRSIHAEVVARAMVRCSYGRVGQGRLVFDSAEIQDLGAAPMRRA